MPTYSLVIPLYNETGSLTPLWKEIAAAMQPYGKDWEAVFVDDGSADGSDAVLATLAAANPNITVISFRTNKGKAAALNAGFAAARGGYVITLDADLQDDPAEIPRFIRALDGGSDLVVGYKKDRRDPFHKTIPSRVINAIIRRASGLALHDVNCGLKGYKREVIDGISFYGELYRFIPVLAASEGFAVSELAIRHRPRLHGKSKYGISRFLRGFLDLMTVVFITKFLKRPLHLFGSLGLLLTAAGIIISAYLTVLHFGFHERVGERPLLLFGTIFIIAGLQLISTGLIAELITYYRERDARR